MMGCATWTAYQVGARNMQNFDLLKDLGKVRRPVLLKRGLSRDHRGVAAVRGVHPGRRQPAGDPLRARHPHLRERDPQHPRHLRHPGGGEAQPPAHRWSTRATAPAAATRSSPWRARGVAAGADGLLIEVHNDPEKALSDGAQSLYPEQFDRLMGELRVIAPCSGARCRWPRCPRREAADRAARTGAGRPRRAGGGRPSLSAPRRPRPHRRPPGVRARRRVHPHGRRAQPGPSRRVGRDAVRVHVLHALRWPGRCCFALADLVAGVREATPLVLNLLFAAVAIVLADRLLGGAAAARDARPPWSRSSSSRRCRRSSCRDGAHAADRGRLLAARPRAARPTRTRARGRPLWPSSPRPSALAAAARYESLFLIAPAAVVLWLDRRPARGRSSPWWRPIVPLAVYGAVSVAHGWPPLPNSAAPQAGHVRGQRSRRDLRPPRRPCPAHAGRGPASARAAGGGARRSPRCGRRAAVRRWDAIFVTGTLLHLQLAAIGWLFRYEAYLVAIGVVLVARHLADARAEPAPFRDGGPRRRHRGRAGGGGPAAHPRRPGPRTRPRAR